MRLQVFHRTRFDYASPVKDSFNEARLQPLSTGGQMCREFKLHVVPATRFTRYTDFQQNVVHVFDVTEPHSSLLVEATSIVTTTAKSLPDDTVTTELSAMAAETQLDRCHDFLQSSRYIEPEVEAWKLGLDVTHGLADAWQSSVAIMRFVHREFAYTPTATDVHTHMRDVLKLRAGVCQDFAHAMIGICRSLNIPARYVSGYLYNGPADQLRGAQASHAWVEVYIPKHGWLGLDPTNDQQPDARYVRLATGRDYADVSPLRGTYVGTNQRQMSVDVLVTSLESAASPAAP